MKDIIIFIKPEHSIEAYRVEDTIANDLINKYHNRDIEVFALPDKEGTAYFRPIDVIALCVNDCRPEESD